MAATVGAMGWCGRRLVLCACLLNVISEVAVIRAQVPPATGPQQIPPVQKAPTTNAEANKPNLGTVNSESTEKFVRSLEASPMPYREYYRRVVGTLPSGAIPRINRTLYPTIFMMGTQKCGSSALYHSIIGHPRVTPPKHFRSEAPYLQKEPGFYFNTDIFQRLPEVYKRKYPIVRTNEQRVALDASPYLMLGWGHCPLRIRHGYGAESRKLRFTFILRNPTLRAWSFYGWAQHSLRKAFWYHRDFANQSFPDAVDSQLKILVEENGLSKFMHPTNFSGKLGAIPDNAVRFQKKETVAMIAYGLYYPNLESWFRMFHPSQFYPIEAKHFESNWSEEMKNLFVHFGLDPNEANLTKNSKAPLVNAGILHGKAAIQIPEHQLAPPGTDAWLRQNRISKATAAALDKLDEFYKPYNEKLYELFETNNLKFPKWGRWYEDHIVHIPKTAADSVIVRKLIDV